MISRQVLRAIGLVGKGHTLRLPFTSYQQFNRAPRFQFSDNKFTSIKKENAETKQFKTQTKRLLDIVAKSLYTDKQVFVRELLSNASDALEKQRFKSQSEQNLSIQISLNETKKQVIIDDNGIGMTREQLINNLGTIARSGSKQFVEQLQKTSGSKNNAENIIGQFGVGFYSSFIVADFVEVISRVENQNAYLWSSDGSGVYEIAEVADFDLPRGTRIILHLKNDAQRFSTSKDIQAIVQKYSNFINFPIKLNGETMNLIKAIWTKDKRDITEQEYKKFFEYLTGSTNEYFSKIHYTADVPLSIKSIIYIPKTHNEKYGIGKEASQIHLYSKKILIKKDCKDILIPNYLRFVKGIVDCEDIPLNISRQNFQDSALMARLKNVVTKKILRHLKQESEKNPAAYNKWFSDFIYFLKEGLLDQDNKKDVLELNRYQTSVNNQLVSLKEYVGLKKEKQDKIFYLYSGTKSSSKNSPYLEPYVKSGVPVLLVNTALDEVVFKELEGYEGLNFVNIQTSQEDLSKYLDQVEHDKTKGINVDDLTTFPLWIKNELQPFVSKVVISKKNISGPGIVISPISNSMRQMNMLRQIMEERAKNGDQRQDMKNLTFQINPNHELLAELNQLRKKDSTTASLIIQQIFDNCCIEADIEKPTKRFTNRINQLLITVMKNANSKGIQNKGNEEDASRK